MFRHRIVFILFLGIVAIAFGGLGTAVCDSETLTVSRGEAIEFSIELLEYGSYGNPVPSQVIEFYDEKTNEFLGSKLTNANGIATLEFSFNHSYPLGLTTLNATFRGNISQYYPPIHKCQHFLVMAPTLILLSDYEKHLAPNDFLVVSASLYDDLYIPLENATMKLMYGSNTLASQNTNPNGTAIFRIQCNKTWFQLGHNEVQLIYEGDTFLYQRGYSIPITFELEMIETQLYLSTTPNASLILNDNLIFDVYGTMENETMSNRIIDIYVDNLYFKSDCTNEDGILSVNISIDSRFRIGFHILRLDFLGNERYLPTSFQLEFDVSSVSLIDINKETMIAIDSDFLFNITITDSNRKPISNLTIAITDLLTNDSYMVVEDYIDLSYNVIGTLRGDKGPRVLKIVLLGNEYLINTTFEYDLLVWSQPQIQLVETNYLTYVSPSQTIVVDLMVEDYAGGLAKKQVMINQSHQEHGFAAFSDDFGKIKFSFIAPEETGIIEIIVSLPMNESFYELGANFSLIISVRNTLSMEVVLEGYTKIHSFGELLVGLVVFAGNGTRLSDVVMDYSWLASIYSTVSQNNGTIQLHLILPQASGIYELEYTLYSPKGSNQKSGVLYIIVDEIDANANQGIGMVPLLFVSLTSFSLPVITILRKRLIVG